MNSKAAEAERERERERASARERERERSRVPGRLGKECVPRSSAEAMWEFVSWKSGPPRMSTSRRLGPRGHLYLCQQAHGQSVPALGAEGRQARVNLKDPCL